MCPYPPLSDPSARPIGPMIARLGTIRGILFYMHAGRKVSLKYPIPAGSTSKPERGKSRAAKEKAGAVFGWWKRVLAVPRLRFR